jgi:hypothetical protein
MRRRRIAGARQGDVPGASAGSRRRSPDDEYLRGMLDLLRALHGRELTEQLFREALALEQLDVAG